MVARRASFHFSKAAVGELNEIALRSRLDERSDVIRIALSAYAELLDLAEAGQKVVIVEPSGREWEYSPYLKCRYPGLRAPLAMSGERPSSCNFFFSAEVVGQIESLKTRCRAGSNSDVIRLALTTYKELMMADELGCRIVVRGVAGGEECYSPYRPYKVGRVSTEVVPRGPVR